MDWIVLKFGGTSVSTLERWQTILEIISEHRRAGRRPFVVCSALSGVTNLLEQLLEEAVRGAHRETLETIRERHLELGEALGIDAQAVLDEPLEQVERLALGVSLVGRAGAALQARVVAMGERLSTALGAAYLCREGLATRRLDATTLLRATDDPRLSPARRYLAAACDFAPDAALQAALADDAADVHLTQGFVAGNDDGETVLIGRGGSDTSAAYFAAKLQARRLEIWTDVPGLFTANPRVVPSARLLHRLAYDEAQELATMGAKVLHPRCLAPVRRHQIPLHIRSTPAPDLEGTIIADDHSDAGARVKAISSKTGITLITMDTLGMWQEVGFLADVFAVFKQHGLSVDLIATSETDVTASLDPIANALDPAAIEALLRDLSAHCTARALGPCAVVSLVGRRIRALLHRLGPALEAFENQHVHLISQAASDLNFSFVVDEPQAEPLVRRLHAQLFDAPRSGEELGPSWQELAGRMARG